MIVEVTADLDLLNATLATTEGRAVSVERFEATSEVPLQSVFWISDAESELDRALDRDPTVTSARLLTRDGGASLYRTRHPPHISMVDAYEAAIHCDVRFLDAAADGDGWWLKLWMADRDSLAAFRDACESASVPIDIRSMYNDEPQPMGDLYGLTERQREVLQLALREGYFQIPRESTLADLAENMDLSSQAASERLRRGMRTLVRNVLTENDPTVNGQFDSERR